MKVRRLKSEIAQLSLCDLGRGEHVYMPTTLWRIILFFDNLCFHQIESR